MEQKCSKEREIVKNTQVEILEMKTSKNQIKTTMNSISSRQEQAKKRI
jgi:hypothetical protein